MKRFHVHVAVSDLSRSIAFYSAMFSEVPTVVKPDYAKWMLEDPRINFAISNRGKPPGINHLGLQAEDDTELEAIHTNLQKADAAIVAEKGANCCYAKSDKYWVTDPQGIAWESFRSLGAIALYGSGKTERVATEPAHHCGGDEGTTAPCCAPSDAKSPVPINVEGECCTP
jgi:hypothetical protein